VVVFGHLLIAAVDTGPDGRARGENLFALRPGWGWLAVLAPMPVFFAAAGFANATVPLRRAAPRLRRLIGTATVVVAAWSVLVVVALVVSDTDLVAKGARLATQPLWFLAAYVPFAAMATRAAAIASRASAMAVTAAGSLVVLAALDLLRFAGGAPTWIGWPGFFLAWGMPWLLGAWWRVHDGGWGRNRERAVGLVLLVCGALGAWTLVRFFGYRAALIDFGDASRSNTTPPTLYTAVAGIAQTGALIAGAGALDRLAARWRAAWSWLGSASIGIYVWHLTALALVVGAVDLTKIDLPRRLTGAWWAIRPLWVGVVVAVALAVVSTSEAARRRFLGRENEREGAQDRAGRELSSGRLLASVVVASSGAAVVGLRGPQSVLLAIACTTLLAGGWALLREGQA
jgi:hypothetical protein